MKRKTQVSPKQAEVLVSPVRADIFHHLAATGPATAREIAKALSLPVTTLYHHLEAMTDGGVLSKAERRGDGTRGRPAVVFGAVKRVMYLTESLRDPARRRLAVRIVRTSTARAVRDFDAAIGDGRTVTQGKRQNLAHIRADFVASKAELKRVNALLNELRAIVFAPRKRRKDGQLLSLTCVMAPAKQRRTIRKRAR
jgi:DNA-binding transcriptional ArsR family regulator